MVRWGKSWVRTKADKSAMCTINRHLRFPQELANAPLSGTFAQAIPGLSAGKFPAIPRNDGDLAPANHIQAIANTAGFHFGYIEQGGSSLYPTLAQGVTNLEVLRILLSIGPVETSHFQTWHDKAGNAPARSAVLRADK